MGLGRAGLLARAVAAGVVVLGVLAAALVLVTARGQATLQAESDARAGVARAIPGIATALRSALDGAATTDAANGQLVDFEDAESRGVPLDLAVRARDTGGPLLHESGVVVVATYDRPAVPSGVAARRAAVESLYTVPLRLETTLDRLRPDEGGIAITGPEQVVADLPGPMPEGVASYSVDLSPTLARNWTVTVWVPAAGVPAAAWLLAGLLLMAALGAAVLLLRREASAAETGRQLGRLQVQSGTVTGLAGVAQRSLDLADVLPAVTTQLTEALGLRGVSLTTPTPEGDRTLFSDGEPVDPGVSTGIPAAVPADRTVSLLLARGGRTVARLHVLTGRPLDRHDTATLTAVAEILTSAVANAEAFGQQRELLHRMRALDELKTVFLATASHELRTPVGVISGFARLLSDQVERLAPGQVRTYADRIDANAQQLGALVENLLDFSRLERGVGLEAEQGLIDLGETVDQILTQHSDLAPDHRVTHRTVPGLLVRGTTQAVERVLTNLVGNAGKYSPVGTAIRVHVRQQHDRAELLVDDEGAGVPAADREQIFSRFFRGRGDAVVNTRGAGLGLAIVSEFAATMGASVSVTSSPSGGARFVVSYPVVEPAHSIEGESHVAS